MALGFTWLVAQEPPPDTPAPESAPKAAASEAPAASDEPTAPEASAPASSESEAPLRRLDLPTSESAQGQAAAPTDDTVERGDDVQAQTDESAESASAAEDAREAVEHAADEAKDAADAAEEAQEAVEESAQKEDSSAHKYHRELVRIGASALLPAGEEAREVVAVFGDVVADGNVHRSSVAVFGDNTTNGDAGEVVAVFGNVRVNGEVRGQVVAVMGSVQLGPDAVVHGDVVCVGGTIDRAPGSEVHRGVQQVGPFPIIGDGLQGLRAWIRTCLVLGRPLAFNADVLWAWGVAGAFIGVYLLIALMFNRPVIACAETLEQRPGMTIVASILAAVATPIILVLLSFIGVGLLLIPVLFFVGLFGKTVFLAWLGRRITLPLGWSHSIGAVLFGGIVLLLLYTIPIAGFLVMKVSSGVGFGMAVYTGILAMRRPQARPLPPSGPSTPPSQPVGVVPPSVPPIDVPVASTSASSGFVDPASVAAAVAAAPVEHGPTAEPGAVSPPVLPPPVPEAGAGLNTPQPAAQAPLQFSTLPRAGFWIRLAASLLDLILIAIVLSFVNLSGAWPVLFGVYCVVLWALRGTTIGGIICGLKVVRLDDRPLDWSVAVVRSLGGYLSVAVIGLGFVWVAFDPERQSWHDKIAGTTIVRVPKGVTLV